MGSITQSVKGSGENVNVIVTLTNLNSGARATLGTYTFNFADKTTTTQSEDIYGAFQQVGGYPEEETQDPTEAQQPTEDNGHKPGENGDYDANGNWVNFVPGSNGDWVNGSWVWYNPEVNGYWGEDGQWKWGQRPQQNNNNNNNNNNGNNGQDW